MSEDALKVNKEGVSDPKGYFYRTTTVGDDVLGSRIVTVTVETDWPGGRPDVETTLGSILVDKDMFQYRTSYK